MRDGCDRRARARGQVAARPRPPAVERLCLPKGHRDDRHPERSRSRDPPARRTADGEFERVSWEAALGDIASRVAVPPTSASVGTWATRVRSPTRTRSGSRAFSTVSARRTTTRRLPGREQPLRRERPALRHAAARAVPRPQAHPPAAHAGSQSAGLARLPAVVAAHPRAAAGRRAGGGGGPAPHGDRPPIRASSDPARHGRSPPALDAGGDLRGGARRPGLRTARGEGRATSSGWRAPIRPRRPRRAPASRRAGARARTRLRLGRRGGCLRANGIVSRPLRHPRVLPPRRAERGDRQPRPPRRRGVRPAADSARRHRRAGRARHLRQAALAHRRVPRRDRQPARVAAPTGDRDARRGPDPRAVRLGREPRPVGAGRRRARTCARTARAVRLARPIHQRDQPPRRLHPAHHHLLRARGPADRADGLLHHALRPVHRGRGRPAG